MEKILISACLVGDKTRYDGKGCYNPLVKSLLEYYELVPFCPEMEGGLKSPRLKSERRKSDVINEEHKDVTNEFILGANKCLSLCRYLNIKIAILKEDSPSCGTHRIYNGLFQNRKVPGMGVAAELLNKNNIRIISDTELEEFIKEIKDKIEARKSEQIERIKHNEEKKLLKANEENKPVDKLKSFRKFNK